MAVNDEAWQVRVDTLMQQVLEKKTLPQFKCISWRERERELSCERDVESERVNFLHASAISGCRRVRQWRCSRGWIPTANRLNSSTTTPPHSNKFLRSFIAPTWPILAQRVQSKGPRSQPPPVETSTSACGGL